MNARKTGSHYEKIAGAFLEKNGYQIKEYNFRCRYAEIDIVAQNGEYLVFCEVKYRYQAEGVQPLEAVNLKKQRRISKAALFYITQHRCENIPCRFDVIGMTDKNIILVQNAFDYIGE